ncbi:hypothetical protein QTP86_021033 [Hemibagrus guttatus]|nr:hypothetical protein QTP86_021033 [Hemibagrus guttatus]
MTGDHGHHQVESGSRLNDSHKHKDKHKDKEHRHKDHKKDKEREKSKYTNSEYRDSSEKKHKDREKERVKHREDSSERYKEKKREEKIKSHSSNGKHKREKENGYVSHIKTEEDNGFGYSPKQEKTVKRERDDDECYRDGQREFVDFVDCVFVDLEKAYDRVPREELWYCMRKSGVAEKYVRVVQDMYERSRTVVRCAVGQTEEFKVEVGLHQGSALSPFLFAMVMDQLSEEVRQESPWTMMFADDIVICSESREQVEENLERWRFALERRGMKVSGSKTEYMCVNEREGSGTVRLQGEEVKKVQEFKYLGSTVQSNGECGKEVKKRVQAGWNGWRKVWGVLCDRKISARIKGKVYRTVVRAAMLYGLETVSLRKRQESELEVAELKMLRFSLGVTRLDRIRNEYIRGTAHVGRLGDKVREARLRWFGHVQRRESEYIGRRMLDMELPGRRQRGRPKRRSEYKPKKIKVEKENKVKKRRQEEDYDDYEEEADVKPKKKSKDKKDDSSGGKKRGKKEPEEKWKWWEEERYTDGSKWRFLEHKGPVFAPPYERLPENVGFYYDGKPMKLSESAEEVATFFAKMLDHEYTTKDIFKKNFFKDWRKEMTSEEKSRISDLNKCNFTEMSEYFKTQSEARKQMTKEEKQKAQNSIKCKMYKIKSKRRTSGWWGENGYCLMDNHKERIGNFRIEPPGLFRGRGDHPKMGMLKRRIRPEDVIINCSKDSKQPKPPPGSKWKEVRHDNKVTWLASWTENTQGSIKYIMLNPSSRIKGEKDWQKYETARRLKKCVEKIRAQYREDGKSKEMRIRQRAVALYFIDKLALRAGNEKEEGESADTVGCCSLRVEHVNLHPEMDSQEYVVELDFLGKDSIRYYNKIPVEKRVFKNLQLFLENKQPEDDVFDRLNTSILNKHLQELMDGLTAKVFRTYNASITLQQQLKELTNPEDNVPAKILSYNRANRAVAILCNHQRAPPKTFEKSMQNLQAKIDAKKEQLSAAKKELKSAKADAKAIHDERSKKAVETKKKAVQRLSEQLMKLEVQATDREENKQIALGTSKLNYLDPRISVAWCKKWGIPIEKIYNKTQREKFAWAIDMADDDYEF